MTTITPPFTGSYAVGLQGINVSRFDLFGVSIAPKLGRNGKSTFLTSGTLSIDVSSDTRAFFDDSLRLPKPVSALNSTTSQKSQVEIISDDTFRIVERPRFTLSAQTFGIEKTTDTKKIFQEMNRLDPTVYINDPNDVAYPVVFGVDSPIDPYDFSGAIEPFALRRVIAGTSTFVGDHDDPEPTGVRASYSSGQGQVTSRNKTVQCTNYYDSNANNKTTPIFEVGDYDIFDGYPVIVPMVSDDANEKESLFVDRPSVKQTFDNVSNAEIRSILTNITTRSDFPNGYPTETARSLPCGFEYSNSRGIDSISYGRLKK